MGVTLIYKRTHSGDPDPADGVFGNHECMGKIRNWPFDSVIGVGGLGQEAVRNRISCKLTWIGIGAHKHTNEKSPDGPPRVAFDHFKYYGENGPSLSSVAGALAKRMYEGRVRAIMSRSLSLQEQVDVEKILHMAREAPPSKGTILGGSWQVRGGRCVPV
jgi:hypothetical protein